MIHYFILCYAIIAEEGRRNGPSNKNNEIHNLYNCRTKRLSKVSSAIFCKLQSESFRWKHLYTLNIYLPITFTPADTGNIPEVTKNEIMFLLQNMKCGKPLGEDGIVTDL